MTLNITIASYGAIGKASSALLQQDHYLGSDKENTNQLTWLDLELADQQQAAEACLVGTDIVFILGDNRSGDAASTAVNLTRRCAERNTPCYALLGLLTEPQDADPLLINMENSASNTLLIRPGAVTADAMPGYLVAAVQNVLHPITGEGMIGVDFSDIRTILTSGKKILFAIAEATGENRAIAAARAAVAQLPELRAARSIICNITGGYDLTMVQFELIGNIVHAAIPDDAIVICSTTLDTNLDSQIQVGITVVLQ